MLGVCSLIGTTSLPPPAAPAVKSRLRTPLPRGPTELGQSCFVCGAVLWLPLLLTGLPAPQNVLRKGPQGPRCGARWGPWMPSPPPRQCRGHGAVLPPPEHPSYTGQGWAPARAANPAGNPFWGGSNPSAPSAPSSVPGLPWGALPVLGAPRGGTAQLQAAPGLGSAGRGLPPPGRDRVHSSRCFPPRAHPLTAFCWPENGVRLQGAADALGLFLRPAPCTLHPAPCSLHPAPCTLQAASRAAGVSTAPSLLAVRTCSTPSASAQEPWVLLCARRSTSRIAASPSPSPRLLRAQPAARSTGTSWDEAAPARPATTLLGCYE